GAAPGGLIHGFAHRVCASPVAARLHALRGSRRPADIAPSGTAAYRTDRSALTSVVERMPSKRAFSRESSGGRRLARLWQRWQKRPHRTISTNRMSANGRDAPHEDSQEDSPRQGARDLVSYRHPIQPRGATCPP